MKKKVLLLAVLLSFSVFSQTRFGKGIKLYNASEITNFTDGFIDRIPVMSKTGLINKYIRHDKLATKEYADNSFVPYVGASQDVILGNNNLFVGNKVTITNKNEHETLISNGGSGAFIKKTNAVWKASSFNPSDGLGVGHYSLLNNSGYSSNGVGFYSLMNNEGDYCSGFGTYSLSYNKGGRSNGIGYRTLYQNEGNYSNGVGYSTLSNNTGDYSNGFGSSSLQYNSGLQANGFGSHTLRYNEGSYNSAFGSYSFNNFYEDTSKEKSFDSTNISTTNNTITVNSHNFGSVNQIVKSRYKVVSGTSFPGINNNQVYSFKILDANTLKIIGVNIAGSATGNYKLVPQLKISNTTTIGANSNPTKSNQVVLGDSNVDEVYSDGVFKSNVTNAQITDGKHVITLDYFNANNSSGSSLPVGYYQEGTWSPVLKSDNNSAQFSYNQLNVKAKYVRTGNLVYYSVRISGISYVQNSNTGNIIIEGLPFTSNSDSFAYNSGYFSNTGSISGSIYLSKSSSIELGSNFMFLRKKDSPEVLNGNLPVFSDGHLVYSGTYTTSVYTP